jgi:hypothetical protein
MAYLLQNFSSMLSLLRIGAGIRQAPDFRRYAIGSDTRYRPARDCTAMAGNQSQVAKQLTARQWTRDDFVSHQSQIQSLPSALRISSSFGSVSSSVRGTSPEHGRH